MGEINKGVVALLIVLIFGAAGYMWYTMLYKPAVADRVTAAGEQQTAESALAAAKVELANAQKAIEEAKNEASKPDVSVAKVQLARKAVPNKRLIDDASIVLTDIARRSGIRTGFDSGSAADSSKNNSGGPQGATPIDLTFKAVGTYDRMMLFMRMVESTVTSEGGKLYARDRLFNVVSLELDGGDKEGNGNSSSAAMMDGGGTQAASGSDPLAPKAGELAFTVTVRMYTSTTENAQNVGDTAPDPAAPATSGTGSNAAGAAGTGADASSAAAEQPAAGAGGSTQTTQSANSTASAANTAASAPAATGGM